MPSQKELDECYMKVALAHAHLSKAKRRKVGACLVTSHGSIIPGVNGTPSGTDNNCEKSVFNRKINDYELQTLDVVLHSELNCILKAARDGISILGSTLYVSLSPCIRCSAMIVQAGIREVVYLEEYRDLEGLLYLQEAGIIVRKLSPVQFLNIC